MLVMWLLMLINVAVSIMTNLRVLKAQLLAIRSFNVDATTTPAWVKYKMFRRLGLYVTAYYLLDLFLFILQWRKLAAPWVPALFRQVLESLTCIAIGVAFRPRPLSAVFEQVQEVVRTLANDLLPQIDTVTVDFASLKGGSTAVLLLATMRM